MVYIFVSFIPWIVYWVLCGAGYSSGVVAPLLLSLLLVTPQINKKDINLMDFVSFFYFFLATVCSFGLNTRVFIAKAVTLLAAAGYREIPARGTEEYRKKKKRTCGSTGQKGRKNYPRVGQTHHYPGCGNSQNSWKIYIHARRRCLRFRPFDQNKKAVF